jgi:ubiquitin-protein ligase E3 A
MFVHKNNSRYFWFNGDSLEAPIMFEFVGVLLGLSIYNSIQLDLHFPNVVYKKLLEDESTPKIDYWKELADV